MSRKSSTSVKVKLTIAQLQEKLEKQEEVIRQLKGDASHKVRSIQILEKKVSELEGQLLINKWLDFVRERVTDELKSQLVDLQQYSRRYSVVIAGVHTGMDEKKNVEEILKEVASTTTMGDVDKLHRIGPPKQGKQDIIVRFKSHTAKENLSRRPFT